MHESPARPGPQGRRELVCIAIAALFCSMPARTTQAQSASDVSYTYDAVNRLTSVRTASGSTALVYDPAGNLTATGASETPPLTLSPAWGTPSGGTRVVVRGTGFDAGVAVTVDGLALPPDNVQVLGPTTLSIEHAAARARPGVADRAPDRGHGGHRHLHLRRLRGRSTPTPTA